MSMLWEASSRLKQRSHYFLSLVSHDCSVRRRYRTGRPSVPISAVEAVGRSNTVCWTRYMYQCNTIMQQIEENQGLCRNLPRVRKLFDFHTGHFTSPYKILFVRIQRAKAILPRCKLPRDMRDIHSHQYRIIWRRGYRDTCWAAGGEIVVTCVS